MPEQPMPVKLSYTHEAMVDLLITRPMISVKDVAQVFGYSVPWVSRLLRSDAFREMVAARKTELRDPILLQGLETRLGALADQAIDVLEEKLATNGSADVALKALEASTRGLGLGQAKGAQVNVNNFVVTMPQKAASGGEWLQGHSPRLLEGMAEDEAAMRST